MIVEGRQLPILLVGAACRLPGAADETAFRALLEEGRCAVKPLPVGRWNVARLLHSSTTEPGFSYSFAGGYLDDPFAFDPTVFGISPREAAQMDPQQRLLLEVVREALEDARLPPSSLAGAEVGVYVGASSLDHGNLHAADPASIDSYFMTGNTLSVVANRISYVYDWHGPSFTVDTACSSSLVAFSQALSDLRSGRIDTAVVAGVNILLSPASFVGFSRASMLSPTGLCRPFSAAGDGYVRAEGAVAFVLRRADLARPGTERAEILAAAVNSDGRTSGIALPGLDGQVALLERIYGDLGLSTDDLAFVEAHGTGTRVGDPIEATALGTVLGRGRSKPLPIGSVKSNIGHLEPASGVAGLLKAVMALETRRLPATLHLEELNPLVDFDELGLAPAVAPVDLDPKAERLVAGVSSFGFGGTNAHVVLRSVKKTPAPAAIRAERLVLSAASREALRASAAAHAHLLEQGVEPGRLAAAIDHDRDRMKLRLAAPIGTAADLAAGLEEFAAEGRSEAFEEGTATARRAKVCFVYSGNGAQWVGMGRTARATNAAFRRCFDEIDAVFARLSGRSLIADLEAPDFKEKMRSGVFVQPLFFAIQSAITTALVAGGLVPDLVLGHSLGEVAAAHAAGAIGLEDALSTVLVRSVCQEALRRQGAMAVFAASRTVVAQFLEELGRDDVEVVAENGPNSVTISGSAEGVKFAASKARKRRIANRVLDVEYPYHTRFIEPLHDDLVAALGTIRTGETRIPLVSTVTGAVIEGTALGADHWWRNMREPVQFRPAIETAAEAGADLFVEIGPKPILVSPISDTLSELGIDGRVIASLAEVDDREGRGDPIARILARAVAHGAVPVGEGGPTPPADRSLHLPTYPWHRVDLHFPLTSERLDVFGEKPRHPLIGARLAEGQPEWRTLLDARIVPYLADHVVEGEIVVPGAALAEMMLAVARDLRPEGAIGVEDLDILAPLVLQRDSMREISVRHDGLGGFVEIWSRPRLGPDEWNLHARGRLLPGGGAIDRAPLSPATVLHRHDAEEIYQRASASGLDYGPAFRLALAAERDETIMDVRLALPDPAGIGLFDRPQLLHPTSLDAALHALFCLAEIDPLVRRTHLPVRFGRLVLHRDGAEIVAARVRVDKERTDSLTVSIWLFDAEGTAVAEVDGLLLRAVVLGRSETDEAHFHVATVPLDRARPLDVATLVRAVVGAAAEAGVDDAELILRAHMRATAHAVLFGLTEGSGRFDPADLVARGRLVGEAAPFAARLAEELVAAGLAERDGDAVRLAAETGLPSPEAILATFEAEFPEASAELLLAARTARELPGFLERGEPIRHRAPVLDQYDAAGRFADPARRAIAAILDRLVEEAGDLRPRILVGEPDWRGLVSALMPRVRRGDIRVVVAGLDRTRLEKCAARLPVGFDIGTLDLGEEAPARPAFDLALLHVFRHGGDDDLLERVRARVIPGGAVAVVRHGVDPLFDFFLGAQEKWFDRSVDPLLPLGRIPTAEETRRRIAASGVVDVEEIALGDGGALIVGRVEAQPTAAVAAPSLEIETVAGGDRALETALAALAGPATAGASEMVRIVPHGRGDDRLRTEAAVGMLRDALASAGAQDPAPRLTFVVATGEGRDLDPVGEAMRDVVRVAMNEHPELDLRLVDVDPRIDAASAATRLLARLAAPDAEREVTIGPVGEAVPRVQRGVPFATSALVAPEAMELHFPRRGALERFSWQPKARRAPAAGEIEIEVVATGLNFRDVMLALGLLDDDVLDDGLAGAVYGFECVGRVAAVGSEVACHAIGDMVFGFAASAFATHVTAPASGFATVPAGISPESAAGIPVAFMTAWYGLVELAHLKAGERVLIHGAAGGVGLAAIQIARARGARVVATVSTPDKRALVELFGAEMVLDSRSLAFADTIRTELGGVDVVLNSLSGDAMRASLKCLKPFGRFIELGKRDYVGNSELALRPFRRNLTYFGVDVDQLLVHAPDVVARGLEDLVAGFTDGVYVPLPIRVFGAAEIGDAFRLMQAAGHVGKILVRPPHLAGRRLPVALARPFAPGAGVQLIVGGTGGFGFATACHLAEKGAKKIVVASRRGEVDEAAEARIAEWRAAGVDFRVETCDATDAAAVDGLIARVTKRLGPISGVWLTAMVLDDGLISGLDDERVARVLAPKIDGAANLDRATRGQPIEQFVLFSSATTLVGNPGQAAYVAANGWMQGLARRRRAEGLPATAIAWGAIADVGVLARDAATARKLERVTGVVGLASSEALHRLDDVLARGTDIADPVVYCARFQQVGAMREMAILRTPAFEGLFGGTGGEEAEAETDLARLIEGKTDAEALRLLGGLIAGEVARILRLSASEVDLGRPLDELGLDSLMALELRMNVETKFGVELPLVAITSVRNLHDLSRRMLRSLRSEDTAEAETVDAVAGGLIAMHGGDEEAFAGLGEEIEAMRRETETK